MRGNWRWLGRPAGDSARSNRAAGRAWKRGCLPGRAIGRRRRRIGAPARALADWACGRSSTCKADLAGSIRKPTPIRRGLPPARQSSEAKRRIASNRTRRWTTIASSGIYRRLCRGDSQQLRNQRGYANGVPARRFYCDVVLAECRGAAWKYKQARCLHHKLAGWNSAPHYHGVGRVAGLGGRITMSRSRAPLKACAPSQVMTTSPRSQGASRCRIVNRLIDCV